MNRAGDLRGQRAEGGRIRPLSRVLCNFFRLQDGQVSSALPSPPSSEDSPRFTIRSLTALLHARTSAPHANIVKTELLHVVVRHAANPCTAVVPRRIIRIWTQRQHRGCRPLICRFSSSNASCTNDSSATTASADARIGAVSRTCSSHHAWSAPQVACGCVDAVIRGVVRQDHFIVVGPSTASSLLVFNLYANCRRDSVLSSRVRLTSRIDPHVQSTWPALAETC